MRPPGSAKVLEARRRRAMRLLDQGLTLNAIARRLGCQASSVMRWRDARAAHGDKGLEVRKAPGRPPRLSTAQKRHLITVLEKGPTAQGYATDLWTTQRVAEVISKRFGVRYHRDHVRKILHQLGWSHQKPERRAVERDEKAIAHWKATVWPRVKKTPRGSARGSSSRTNRASS